jgi:hypothetical protein
LYAFLARRGYESDDIRRVLVKVQSPEVDGSPSA